MKRFVLCCMLVLMCFSMSGCVVAWAESLMNGITAESTMEKDNNTESFRSDLLDRVQSLDISKQTERAIGVYNRQEAKVEKAGNGWKALGDAANWVNLIVPPPFSIATKGMADGCYKNASDAKENATAKADSCWDTVMSCIASDEAYADSRQQKKAQLTSTLIAIVIVVAVVLVVLVLLLVLLKKRKTAPVAKPIAAQPALSAPAPVPALTTSEYHKLSVTDEGHMRLLREACAKTGKDADYYLSACNGDVEKAYYMANSESMGFAREE